MSRGCGCQTGILKWFKPPYADKFYAACCCHDDDYDIGGDEASRLIADNTLFHNIEKIIFQEEVSPFKTIWLHCFALLYYISVRMFGKDYFNYKSSSNNKL
jgi:hypothetical protein